MTENTQAKPAKCTNCGSSEFEWGWVHQRGLTHYLMYSLMDEGRSFGRLGWQVKARRCVSCNHIAFFCDDRRSPLIIWPRFSLLKLFIVITVLALLLGFMVWVARS